MIGKSISHFKIQSDLGEGGMGKVYLALDTELQREVALKFLLPHLTEDEKTKSRFKQEARTLATLNHPNIITIFEVGEFEGRSFIATEYVKGENLESILFNKTLSIKQILDIVMQLCDGLHEAHAQGVVHRDIKPGNILIETNGHVKILDFGLAKLKEAGRKTSTLATLGTLYYLSPEQIQNENVDQRADIFAIGIILYEMISGQLPFKGDHEAAVIYSILNEEPEPLSRYKSNISPNLQNIVFKALRKNPDLRYQHIDDLRSDLKNELSETETSTKFIKKPVEEKTSRKLAAIMFTDIFRYSHMMGKDEEKTFKLLEDYDTLVTPLIHKQNGQILKKIGDGLFCEFSSAIDAVECSLDIQTSIHDYNQKKAKKNNILVRIGIHVGDVIKKDNDLFGDGVNVAARIEPLAPPGGIYVSDSVHSAISSHPKFKIKNIGPSSLKNIEKQHNLYQILTGLESDSVDMKPIDSSAPNDISSKQTTFSLHILRGISTRRRIILLASLGLIVVAIIFFRDNLYDFFGTIQKNENPSQSIESGNDDQSVNSEVSKILKSSQSETFRSDLLGLKDSKRILEYLKKNQDLGKLKFGRKNQFTDLDGIYVIILDDMQIYTILLYYHAEYFETMNDQTYTRLSDKFRGKRSIWTKLL